ncbi:MAG: hypothetical protein ABIW46_08905 [Acidimicrobiales bacterium]
MANRTTEGPATPGRQALVLLGAVLMGFLVGTAAGAPFDLDVGAGHGVFHLVVATFLGLGAFWLVRHGGAEFPFRFAQWSATALAVAQVAEGIAAIADGSGDSTAHEIPSVASLVVLQPVVLLAILVLGFQALRRRLADQH